MSKQKQPSAQVPLQTRAASMSSKLATIAATAPSNSSLHTNTFDSEAVSMSNLISVLDNQRASLREDMHTLIQGSISPLQASVDNLRATVNTFQGRLASAESLAGKNFERLSQAETSIKKLQAENATLWDKLDNMENRACRSNLRIVNVPEGIEDGQDPVKFVSGMLNEIMGDVFDKPPELERAHRSLAPKPKLGDPPRSFIACFHQHQEKERALGWARQHELKFQGKVLRVHPDLSTKILKKCAAFNVVKHALYQKEVQFRLVYPAHLRVFFEDQTFTFETPWEAQAFFDRRIATPK